MDPRTDYLFQILDKIGGPLVAALAYAERAGEAQSLNPDAAAREDAQTIAQLLARSVQTSIEIGRLMELDMSGPEEADRLRLALMVLAGPLVAGQFRNDGRVPGDAEQKKIMTGLEAVLAFSQNFSPTRANAEGLAGGGAPDEGSETIRAMRCFTPVINAVGAFPFGQPEKKLIQDVCARITARVEELAGALLSSASSADKLLLTKTLAEIYAECHIEEMRLMLSKGQEEPDVQQGLDNVWIRFNIRSAMLEALAETLTPDSAAKTVTPAPAAPAPPAEAPAPPKTVVPEALPVAETLPPAPPPGGFNPMSMFAKKDEADGEPASPPAPPAAEPAPEPPAPPPALPKEEDTKDEGTSGEGDGGDGSGSGTPSGSPMSFFKK
jgi:hypothetical protein